MAPIARCVSDTVVDSVLCEFGERFKGCLAIVGTKVDDPMTSTLFKHRYRKAAKKLDKIEKSLAEAEANGCQEEVERLTNVRLRFMVRTRNHEIAKDIYESKSEYFEKSEYGPVFFVSNERYMWLKGYKESGIKEAATQFSAELTGIPALREYALSIPAQEMWLTFMTYIQHTIVTFMKSLAIWAARTSADQGKKLRSIKERSMKASSNSSWVGVLAKDSLRTSTDPLQLMSQPFRETLYCRWPLRCATILTRLPRRAMTTCMAQSADGPG